MTTDRSAEDTNFPSPAFAGAAAAAPVLKSHPLAHTAETELMLLAHTAAQHPAVAPATAAWLSLFTRTATNCVRSAVSREAKFIDLVCSRGLCSSYFFQEKQTRPVAAGVSPLADT